MVQHATSSSSVSVNVVSTPPAAHIPAPLPPPPVVVVEPLPPTPSSSTPQQERQQEQQQDQQQQPQPHRQRSRARPAVLPDAFRLGPPVAPPPSPRPVPTSEAPIPSVSPSSTESAISACQDLRSASCEPQTEDTAHAAPSSSSSSTQPPNQPEEQQLDNIDNQRPQSSFVSQLRLHSHRLRGTAVLLLMSNVLVLLIHKLLFTGQNKSEDPDEMLFINFIGIEPKNLIKVVLVDFITITLQVVILQCKGDPTSIRFLSALPVPASIDLVHIDEDPNISRPVEHTTDQHQQREDDSTQESPET